ncbi:hypothetical protein HUJ05_007171 [Dendroctonus ponderosae]|nr:hypothetical protein HUJ05_007171 [Dendroctonus ponderosae]
MGSIMAATAIFGSTGTTGLCATEAAVKKGLQVKVLVRDPLKLPAPLKEQVEAVEGNVLNYEDVLRTVRGTERIVVVLGTRNDLKPTTELSEGMKNIVKAAREANVDVISICLSAFLFYEPDKVPPMFTEINAEHKRMLEVVKQSDLKYIAVFPPHIAVGRVVSKYDLGQFLVDCLDKPEFYRQVVGIASKQD